MVDLFLLDNLDKKILFELDVNCRQPLSLIAKKVKTSKQVVKYRLDKLLQAGVIKKFVSFIRVEKFGFIQTKTYLRFDEISQEQEQELISFFIDNPSVVWLASSDGKWDLMIAASMLSVFHFENFLNEISTKYGKFIKDRAVSITTQLIRFNGKFLVEKAPLERIPKPYFSASEQFRYDDLDLKILMLLSNNARLNLVELAFQLNVSPDTINYRLKNLVSKDVIVGNRVFLDYALIGYSYYSLMLKFQNLTLKRKNDLISFCSVHPNILILVNTVGINDMDLQIMVKSSDEFHEVLRELKNNFSDIIQSYELLLISKELNRDTFKVGKQLLKK